MGPRLLMQTNEGEVAEESKAACSLLNFVPSPVLPPPHSLLSSHPHLPSQPPSSPLSQTAEEFLDDYTQRLNSSEGVYNFEFTAYHIYDAAWTLAFAMNK